MESLTVVQNILIKTVVFVINVLYFLDTLTLPKISKRSKLAYLIAVNISIFFLNFYLFTSVINSYSILTISNIEGTLFAKDWSLPGAWVKNYPAPIAENIVYLPPISAKAYGVFDRNSGEILVSKNLNEKYAPASTTKLMTALVAMDIYSLDEDLIVTQDCLEIDSTKVWLPIGQRFTIRDLISGMLISSAGDAACILASGKISNDEFVEKMNEKARKIRMQDSNFTNAIGLDGVDGAHYSTVKDLYTLAVNSTNHQIIKDIVRQKSKPISNDLWSFDLVNTNKLLWDNDYSVGIKTGTTVGAGEVLIYEYNDNKKDLIIIVLGSADRFMDTKNLLSWTLDTFVWKD